MVIISLFFGIFTSSGNCKGGRTIIPFLIGIVRQIFCSEIVQTEATEFIYETGIKIEVKGYVQHFEANITQRVIFEMKFDKEGKLGYNFDVHRIISFEIQFIVYCL